MLRIEKERSGGLTLASYQVHIRLLSHPLSPQQGRGENMMKSSWVKIMTGRSFTRCHHWKNRLDLGKINLLPFKNSKLTRNKKLNASFPHCLPFLQGPASILTLLPPHPLPEQHRGMGNWVCGQLMTLCFCCPFLLTLFSCSSVGCLHRM